jgi:hypothetical protein
VSGIKLLVPSPLPSPFPTKENGEELKKKRTSPVIGKSYMTSRVNMNLNFASVCSQHESIFGVCVRVHIYF